MIRKLSVARISLLKCNRSKRSLINESVQVFKAIGTFRGESKLSTWIYRIAINLCKNRAKYLRVRHSDAQDELEEVAERVPLGEARRANVGQVERPDEMVSGKQVELIDNVRIARTDAQNRPTVITTSRATVFPDKEYAQTQQAVRIEAANGVTTAQGMKAYMNDGKIDLLSNVRGQHEVR